MEKNNLKNQPFFIVGCPRSGTTLLRIMLASHPLISIPPECKFLLKLEKKWRNKIIKEPNQIQEFLSDLYSVKRFDELKIKKRKLKLRFIKNIPFNFKEAISLIYKQYQLNQNKKGIHGDKNTLYVYNLEKILSIYPNAKIIHIIRDGRAVLSSNLKTNKLMIEKNQKPIFPEDEYISYYYWKNAIKFTKKLQKNNNYLEISYRNLLLNPEKKLKQICKLINIDFNKKMLKFSTINKKTNLVPKNRKYYHKNTFEKIKKKKFMLGKMN